jgi:threonine aldolase
VLTPSYGAVYCHPSAHINVDECGAPELFTGGAKLVLVPGEDGKINPESLTQALESSGAGVVHHVQPAVLSLTQATEAGTVYQLEEIRTLSKIAKAHNLYVHMDGARFANALVSLGCSPAAMTWQAGIDVLSFGATKNGAMAAEAVLFFNPDSNQSLGKNFPFHRKRGGHLFSKMRFLSAQLVAYLENDLWLKNALHANQMATKLAQGLQGISGVKILFPVEANEIFVEFAPAILQALQAAGFKFYIFDGKQLGRLVTAFDTLSEDVEKFIEICKGIDIHGQE